MASRNFNFPQSYGSSVVMMPLNFETRGIGVVPYNDVTIINETPSDGYNFAVTSQGAQSGAVSVFTKDAFPELLSVNVDTISTGTNNRMVLENVDHLPNGTWRIDVRQFLLVAGVWVSKYLNSTIYMNIILRNSSTKF